MQWAAILAVAVTATTEVSLLAGGIAVLVGLAIRGGAVARRMPRLRRRR